MSDVNQFVLIGKNMSGRGVRFLPLLPPEHSKVMLDAAKQMGPESTVIELKSTEWTMGVRRMILAVTKETGLVDPLANGATWRKLNAAQIDEEYDTLFNSKDDAVLKGIYRDYHEVSADEIDTLRGKVIAVSEA